MPMERLLTEKLVELLDLAKTMLAALGQYRLELGVKHNPDSLIRNAFDAAIAAEDAYCAALGRRHILSNALIMAEDDPRWHAFGLNPVSFSAPAASPEWLVVIPGTAGHVTADWARAERVEHYRIYPQPLGVEYQFTLAQVADEGAVRLNSMTRGARVRIHITATNEVGESKPSETIEIQVPQLANDSCCPPPGGCGCRFSFYRTSSLGNGLNRL